MSTEIARLAVVGAGQMGAGPAEVCARAGLDVLVCEQDAPSADGGRIRILASLDRAVRAGKRDRSAAERASWRLRFTTDLGELSDRQRVIEAVAEHGPSTGFVVNALLVPYLLSAIRMVESGVASAADVDRGVKLGAAHPMGPLRLTDLIGLDTVAAIADSLYAEFKETLHAPPPLLLRMVDAGLLGTKSGRGFYVYEGK
ncbi:3-hydroxyacyl-CoA dehydrogenase family protein [Saccharopolyspora spinosa]|uniref:3-hydroxyacyl-CoA dehydrogenase-like protein n=1 Tax=Saccharopolyspora spinosa TaxID=60894 RepID=A0A2N3Y1E5_SACSN|nr:3-hydroxyacyl-CoA dehydrogenase family protein [Saccharopolyspora spinosa]PKW16729.1 3-hydroxyacyl-CoA dehydrogenase-like protein [Saccharopolyspora spinosa]